MKAAIALLAVVTISAVPFAFAQFQPTLVQLEECADIGISADECTEEAIASERCIGCFIVTSNHPPAPDPNIALTPIYAGIAIAFVAGVLYVRRTKDSRKARQSQ
ncbi:hypothetical protein [Candidatus Nitrososphaera sp. FF02]|uniref:hypothetical protein n=1 Tax=Candidatus Nitrososphaera sp. FF02 TaxID=3398226 RepID=UPI0039E7E75C